MNYDIENGIKLITKAMNFAANAHKNQMRKDGSTPYINHPIGVANFLTELGDITDPDIIAAALLHDTVEDTDVTIEDIQNTFGTRISSIVAEVTDDKTLPRQERKRLQVVHAPHLSVEAKLVKLADKLYNLKDSLRKTPIGWTDETVQEYFEWASQVISGLKGTNENIEKELIQTLAKRNVQLK